MRTERLKALLWREWKLSRKFYLSSWAALLGMMLVYVLFEMSMRFGNLKSLDTDELTAVRMVISFLAISIAAYGPIAAAGSDNGMHKKDIQANWLRYSYALPVTPEERAAARMILLVLMQAAGFLLSVLGLAFALRMVNWQFSIYAVLILLVILDISLLVILVQYVLVLRARDMKAYAAQQTKYISVMIGAGVVVGLLAARKMSHFASPDGTVSPALQEAVSQFEKKLVTSPDSIKLYDLVNLMTMGHGAQFIETAKHLLPLTIPLTVVLYVLLYLVIRSNLKGAWKHDRSAL